MFHPLSLPAVTECAPDDLTICGVTVKVTGNKGLGQTLEIFLGTPLHLIVIILIAIVFRRLLHKFIERTVTRITNGHEGGPAAATRRSLRARTLASVLQSITTALVAVLTVLMVLQELGYSIAPLLASAGVVGVAVGFGAQSLVKDILSGMFMIVEDQYGVGDVIDVGGDITGTVEAVGLRITRLRDVNGTVWFIRNGEILKLGNKSQGWSRAVVDVDVASSTDVARAEAILREEGAAMREDPQFSTAMLAEPEVWGVESMTKDGLVIRMVVKTQPLQQWPVARELRRRINARFEAEGIGA